MSQLEVDKIIPQSGTTLTIGDSGDTITFGTGTTPQLGGDLDTNGNDINFGDNDKAQFGDSNDLQIYHDGSNSYIQDNGTGALILEGTTSTQIKGSTFVILRSNDGENMAVGNANGSFDLYYNNSKKFETTNTGVDVTGTVTSDGLTVDGNFLLGLTTGGASRLTIDGDISHRDNASGDFAINNFENASITFGTYTGNTGGERMRIDNSGNLLVGKTSTSSVFAGTTLWSGGYLNSTVASDYVARFNRTTTDGDIIQIYKDNSPVGLIGTTDFNGSKPFITNPQTNGAGIGFYTNEIFPTNSSGAPSGAVVSLGKTVYPFNNLYLSGSVYLGGTTSANALDDYEEGTWTPVDASGAGLSFTVSDATYSKVGRIVTCYARVTYPSTADGTTGQIGGLPFTNIVAAAQSYGAFTVYTTKSDVYWLNGSGAVASAAYDVNGNGISNANLSGKQFRLVWVYAEN